jgi:hypothetical protein
VRKQLAITAMTIALLCGAPISALALDNDPAGDEWEAILQHCKVDHAIAQRCMKSATDIRINEVTAGGIFSALGTADATMKLVSNELAKNSLQLATAQHPVVNSNLLGN